MKIWKKLSSLMLLILIVLPITIMCSVEDSQGIKVKIRTQGPIDVHVFRDLILNVSKVHDSDTMYLSVHNLGSENLRVFWHSNLNTTFYDLSAIWFMTVEYIVWRYGNIWRSYNGGYFSESCEWFKSLPTAGWMLWPSGYDGEMWLKGNGILNAHFTLQCIQPPENASLNFTLTFFAY